MTIDNIRSDRTYSGNINFAGTVALPNQTVDNNAVKNDAAISASKLQHQHPITAELAEETTAVVAIEKLIHISRVIGEVAALEAVVITAATGADRTVNIDLQKSTAAGAFATVLTSTLEFDDSSTALTVVAAVVDATEAPLADGDLLKLVITVAGSAGDQAIGLMATITLQENAS